MSSQNGLSYPVLKYSDFDFQIAERNATFKKWNDITFPVVNEYSMYRARVAG